MNKQYQKNNKRMQTHEYFIDQVTKAIKNTLVYHYEQKLIERKGEKDV